MNKKTKKLSYEEAYEIAKEDGGIVWFRVESNPFGYGKPTNLKFMNDRGGLSSFFSGQGEIYGVDYTYAIPWRSNYTGTFDLVSEPKGEVYPKGSFVRVNQLALEYAYCDGPKIEIIDQLARECAYWDGEIIEIVGKEIVGKVFKILESKYSSLGVYYDIGGYYLPHGCVDLVDDEGTIKIGDNVYYTREVEETIKNLKPLN
jgi:hypothetical protein